VIVAALGSDGWISAFAVLVQRNILSFWSGFIGEQGRLLLGLGRQ
jgi:hypothetical protein